MAGHCITHVADKGLGLYVLYYTVSSHAHVLLLIQQMSHTLPVAQHSAVHGCVRVTCVSGM